MGKHHLGKRLRELRIKAGLTQRELAERTGLHITTVANYEINRREPKANQLKLLSGVLGADIDALFTAEDGDQDERNSKRRYLIAEVSLRLPHRELPALSINISHKGIGLYTEERLETGEDVIVTLKILMKGAPAATEDVTGIVVWTRLLEKRYAAGIRFKKAINSKDFPILSKCIEYTAAVASGEGYGK